MDNQNTNINQNNNVNMNNSINMNSNINPSTNINPNITNANINMTQTANNNNNIATLNKEQTQVQSSMQTLTPQNVENSPQKGKKPSENKPEKKKMTRFNYKVKNEDGKIIEDYIDAEKESDVQSFLLSKNLDIVSIKEDKLSTSLGLATLSTSKKLSSKELNFFLTQLSTYVKSGISLVDSMEILSRQVKNKNTQMIYRKIVFGLNKGLPFSECLTKQGRVFPKMLINMVKTSEMTGDLVGVLDDMAAYYKREDSNRKQIISALIYPSVLFVFSIIVLTFVIVWIVPQFENMYASSGSNLPKLTQDIMNISKFVTNNWYYIILGVAVVIIFFTMLFKNSKGFKYIVQYVLMHIPVISDIIKNNQLITFTSTFAALIKHDVFITDSMDILGKITDNEIYKEIINQAIDHLSKGDGVSVAFKGKWAFPETAYEMLVTGEKTGRLGEMMDHVASYYQEEQSNIVTRLKSLIEPLTIILLALLVGVILLSVVYPMFDIYNTII